MKCPSCRNTQEFKYFYIGWSLRNIEMNEAGEVVDSSMEDSDIDYVKEILCSICDFVSLPEAFGNRDYKEWRKVQLGEDGRYSLLESEEVSYWHTMLVGHRQFDVGGDVYMKLYKIHTATSIANLPEMIVDDNRAVRNSAAEKMEELI